MNILNSSILNRRALYLMAAILVVVAAFLPALTSAAQITQRSVQLSSASVDAQNVTYQVNFTPAENAGAFVVDFCTESPIIGQACTAPAGFDATGVTSTTSGFTDVAALEANTVRVTGTITGGGSPTPVSVDLAGIDNPSAAGTIYARIATYESAADANGYTSTNPNAVGDRLDDGGVAIAITETIGVSGAVLESLSFCVAGEVIAAEGCVGTYDSPILQLGEAVGSTVALAPDTLSTGQLHGQITTNALGGAVISLKSSAVDCGGLMRAGSTDCDIVPAPTATSETGMISGANGYFGLLVANANDAGANANGVVQASTGYSDTDFFMEFASGNATGVTSTYGSQIMNTGNAPVNNRGLLFTFGASAKNNTPAGMYAADMTMIATGTF